MYDMQIARYLRISFAHVSLTLVQGPGLVLFGAGGDALAAAAGLAVDRGRPGAPPIECQLAGIAQAVTLPAVAVFHGVSGASDGALVNDSLATSAHYVDVACS